MSFVNILPEMLCAAYDMPAIDSPRPVRSAANAVAAS